MQVTTCTQNGPGDGRCHSERSGREAAQARNRDHPGRGPDETADGRALQTAVGRWQRGEGTAPRCPVHYGVTTGNNQQPVRVTNHQSGPSAGKTAILDPTADSA